MRPIGSTNGRIPEGGYPDLSPEMGAFLSGFIEGEGCFGIVKATRGYGYKPNFSMVARDDDGALIRALHGATNIGRVRHMPAHRTSRPQVSWRVGAKSDCKRLMEILDANPLRGRKADSYRVWREAAQLWIGDDPTARIASGQWEGMAEWKEELSRVKRYQANSPASRAVADRGWSSFLAGLVTAEGCFSIQPGGTTRFSLHMRADDAPMLQWLQEKTGLGKLSKPRHPGGRARHPSVTWNICSNADKLALADLLERFPPGGRKLLEFLIWRSATIERAACPGCRRDILEAIRQRLLCLREYRVPGAGFT